MIWEPFEMSNKRLKRELLLEIIEDKDFQNTVIRLVTFVTEI